ncbi:MAG: patatin-like phospholipase family protein [Vicinamibacteria bacterium]|nr:patatin-like phospholipase family protein [Vicinamibacteria bacterium]
MADYSPKRRTAVLFVGSGASGAYHAGVLKALDETGIKVDLLVGSGIGTVAAAFGAVAGGARLHEAGGFWDGVERASFFRLRPALRTAALLLGAAFAVFLLPVLLGVVLGALAPVALIVDLVAPGWPARALGRFGAVPEALGGPYLATLAAPVFVLSILALVVGLRLYWKDRRRFAEQLEHGFDAEPARTRLSQALWEVARGAAVGQSLPSDAEVARRFVAALAENLGQPGFRELILRTADLDTGAVLPFVLLQEEHKQSFAAARARGPRSRLDGLPGAIDLRSPACEALLFDAVFAGLLLPGAAPVRRVAFPKGGLFGGETHRLADATLVGGCGISEALAAGAEQLIVVAAVPEVAHAPARRRGPGAIADGLLGTLERRAVDADLVGAERMSRVVRTLGLAGDGASSWEDPATGRQYRDVALWTIRPERNGLGPMGLDGSTDPATEACETVEDLLEQGYRDAYRLFLEPVVGAAPEARSARDESRERERIGL